MDQPPTVQSLFFNARGVSPGRQPAISRSRLIEIASELPGAPDDLDTHHLRALEIGTRPPPGEHLRFFAAAAGIPLLDLLAAAPIGYWPEIQAEGGKQAAFRDLCSRWGLTITKQLGNRFVVEVSE